MCHSVIDSKIFIDKLLKSNKSRKLSLWWQKRSLVPKQHHLRNQIPVTSQAKYHHDTSTQYLWGLYSPPLEEDYLVQNNEPSAPLMKIFDPKNAKSGPNSYTHKTRLTPKHLYQTLKSQPRRSWVHSIKSSHRNQVLNSQLHCRPQSLWKWNPNIFHRATHTYK